MGENRANYDVGTLESTIEIQIKEALGAMDSIINSIDKLKSTLSGTLNNNTLKTLTNDMKNLKEESSSVDPILKKLKELQSEFNKSGNSQLSNQIKEFSQQLYKAEYSNADNKIKEIREIIEKKLGSNFVKEFNKSLEETENKSNILSFNNLEKITKLINISSIYFGLRKIANITKNIANANIEMTETNNLFEVSMGKVVDQYGNLTEAQSQYYIEALKFQNEMNEKLGTNKIELMNFQAMYYSMFKSQNINKDASYFMSEQLTKAGYDIASLYNLTIDDAMDKIKSGIAGQVEPLRKIGVDISESALSKVLNDVGITDRSVQQLSYAEKEVARYIAIVEQAKQAQGDFAKTFENPANQIRVFKNQFEELKQVAGSFIINTFGGILKYVNAIIMVLKEILKSFANLFGYDLSEGGANLSTEIGADDLNDNLGSAIGKVKELKKQLMGFDEINNITPETQSGNSGNSSITGIDDKLLQSLKEWDNQMSSISGKAQEIRDNMLEWLGFKRDDDGTWKLKEGLTNFEKILDVTKAIGLALLSWTVGGTVIDIFKNLGILNGTQAFQFKFGLTLGLTGIYAQYKGTSHLLDGDVDLFTILETVLGTGAGALGIVNILKATKFGESLSLGNQLKIGFGIMFELQGIQTSYTAMKEFKNGTKEAEEAFKALAIGIGEATGAGILMGSKFGALGAIIGGTAGFIISATSASLGYTSQIREQNKMIAENIKQHEEFKNTLKNNVSSQVKEIENIENLRNELEKLVDSNGKVKKGYESRVSYVLNELNKSCDIETEMIDGTIKNYNELQDTIENVIQTKKNELVLSAYEEQYEEAIKNRAKAYKDLKAVEEEYNKTKIETTNRIQQLEFDLEINRKEYSDEQQARIKREIETEKLKVKNAEENVKSQQGILSDYNKFIYDYELFQTATITDNKELQKSAYDELVNTIVKDGELITLSGQEQIDNLNRQTKEVIKTLEEKGKKVTAEETQTLNGVLNLLAEKLTEQTKTVEDLTPENLEAWKTLAKGNYDIYKQTLLNNIAPEMRKTIQETTGTIVEMTPEAENATNALSNKMIEKLDKSSEAKEKGKNTIVSYKRGIADNQQRNELYFEGKNSVQKIMNGLEDADDSEEIGVNILIGLRKGLQNDYWQGRTLSTASNFASGILGKFKSIFQIHSPSKKTKEYGIYLLEGLGNGINQEEYSVLKTVSEFSNNLLKEFNEPLIQFQNGIKINAQDMSLDATQYIDYGAINGQIDTRSNLSINGTFANKIAEASYNAFCQAMKDEGIKVNVEAKTEEGIVFKKVQAKAEEYAMQTGENPFPVLA